MSNKISESESESVIYLVKMSVIGELKAFY